MGAPGTTRGPVRIPYALAAVAGVVGFGLAQLLWGEVIPVGGGLGWDGRTYAALAQDFPRLVFEEKVDAYRLGRVLPSGLVHLGLRTLGLPRDLDTVRHVFAAYNLILLAATAVVWGGIARAAGLGSRGRWLGLALLFLNFAQLKMPFYYAPLTDTTAFALGALLVYFHLRSNGGGALAVLILGAFSWPSFLAFGAPLLLFPRRPLDSTPPGWPWPRFIAAGVGVLLLYKLLQDTAPLPGPARLALGVVALLAYLVAVFEGLGRHAGLDRLATWTAAVRWRRVLAFALCLGAVQVAIHVLARGTGFTTAYFLGHAARYGVAKPGLFVVSHWAYFGVVVPLAMLLWPRVCQATHRLGLGLTLYLALHFVWGVHPESRQIVDGLPAVVLVVVIAAGTVRWARGSLAAVVVLGLAASKFWLPLNSEGFLSRSDPFLYPAQYYFMNHGPWMSDGAYGLQGAAAVAVALVLLAFLRRGAAVPVEPAGDGAVLVPRPALKAAAVVFGLAAACGGIEVAARMSVPRASPAEAELSLPEPILGWENPPGSAVRLRREGYDVELRINSRGLRGPDRPHEKPAGVRRVLFLGGSIPEAYTVLEEDSSRAVLERLLNARGGPPYEVLNAAVASYSTDQAYLRFIHDGWLYAPDDVVVFVSAEEVYRNTTGEGGKPRFEITPEGSLGERIPPEPVVRPRRPAPRPVLVPWRGSMALRFLSNWTFARHPRWHRRLAALGLVDRGEPPPALRAYGPRAENREMWRCVEAIVGALKARVEPRGRLVVVYLPALFEVQDEAWEQTLDRYVMNPQRWDRDKVARRLEALCHGLGVRWVDPRPSLRRAESAGRRTYLAQEGLWTRAGHEAVAQELAASLTDN